MPTINFHYYVECIFTSIVWFNEGKLPVYVEAEEDFHAIKGIIQ